MSEEVKPAVGAVLVTWSFADIADSVKAIMDRADALVQKYGPPAQGVYDAAKAFAAQPNLPTAGDLYATLTVLAHVISRPMPASAVNWNDLSQFAMTIAQILKMFL